jgi:nicotinamidase-related amidase
MTASSALVVIDMLNRYEHQDAEALMQSVRDVVPVMAALIGRAQENDVPIIYVNDNHGDWSAGEDELCRQALSGSNSALVEPVLPPPEAAFVTKARHSIFYETPLDYLLRSWRIERLVLTGQVTEQCVLYSALDAYVRQYHVTVPRDAVAAIHQDLAAAALGMMETNMRAEIIAADELFAGDSCLLWARVGSGKGPDPKGARCER